LRILDNAFLRNQRRQGGGIMPKKRVIEPPDHLSRHAVRCGGQPHLIPNGLCFHAGSPRLSVGTVTFDMPTMMPAAMTFAHRLARIGSV